MPMELTYPHIVKMPGEQARLESQPRTRVSMIVRDHLECGLSADEIVRQYPYLKRAEVHAALAYYFDHQEEIDREVDEENRMMVASNSQAPLAPVVEKLRALKKTSGCP